MDKFREKYEAYDSSWKKEFFDEHSGGYVVVHIERERHSTISKNEQAIYEKEIEMVMVFARNGYHIEMLPEIPRISSHDVNIEGIPAELKKVVSANNIAKRAKKAVRKQGAQLVLFSFPAMNAEISKELSKLVAKNIHGKFYVIGEEIVKDF